MCFRYKVYPFFDDRSESVRWGVGLFESAEGTFQYEEEDQDEDYTQSYKPHRHRRQSHGRGVRRRYENDYEEDRQKKYEDRHGGQYEKGGRHERRQVAEEPRRNYNLSEKGEIRGKSPWYRIPDGIIDLGYADTRSPSPEYDYTSDRPTHGSRRSSQYGSLDPDEHGYPRWDQGMGSGYDNYDNDSEGVFIDEELEPIYPEYRGKPDEYGGSSGRYVGSQGEYKETQGEYDGRQRENEGSSKKPFRSSSERSSFDDFDNSGRWPSDDGRGNPYEGFKGFTTEPDVQFTGVAQPPPDHYATLGLNPTASQSEINMASKLMRIKTHPDKLKKFCVSPEEEADIDAAAAAVGQAADVLKDPEQRALYDHEVRIWNALHG